MISHCMLPHILQPTRVTDHSATVIDNIFSNNTEHNTLSGSILSRISDHFPQFLVMTKVNIDYKRCSFAKRDFSNLNEQKFISDFSNINHSFLYDNDKTLNYKFDNFYENLNSYVNRHVPTKKMTKKDLKFCSKPWINSRIKNLMKYRDRLLRKLNKKYTLQNEYLYKKFRNRVVNELRTSKIDYYKKYFTEHRDNIKMLWNGIRSIINVQNSKFNNISQIIQNGQTIKYPKDIAESLNQYFVNVTENIDKEIPRTRKCPLDYMGVRNISSFFVSPTDEAEVTSIISQMQTGKSVGPFSIPLNLLKMLKSAIAPSLAVIINESCCTGIFPDKRKIAKVIAIHKKGSTDNPSNYRPISLLSVFSKTFEKLMHKRLYNLLKINEIIRPLQFGFRKKHSTAHALISMTEHIKSSIESGKFGCGIFIDLKKAFGTVNHTILF